MPLVCLRAPTFCKSSFGMRRPNSQPRSRFQSFSFEPKRAHRECGMEALISTQHRSKLIHQRLQGLVPKRHWCRLASIRSPKNAQLQQTCICCSPSFAFAPFNAAEGMSKAVLTTYEDFVVLPDTIESPFNLTLSKGYVTSGFALKPIGT